MKIAAIGEAMIEMSITGDQAELGVAGDTLNTAIYLKRAAPQIDVDYITRLGRDGFSERIKSCLLYTSPSPRDRSLSRMPSSA